MNEGLVAGFLGVHSMRDLASLLEIPEHHSPIGVVTVGYPMPDRRSAWQANDLVRRSPGALGRLMDITSSANPRIKRLVALRDRKERERESVFIVEGSRDLARTPMVTNRWRSTTTRSTSPTAATRRDRGRWRRPPSTAPPIGADRKGDRVFGIVRRDPRSSSPGPNCCSRGEAIEKPGNLGGLLRIADAVGADAVIAGSRHRPVQPERGSSIDRSHLLGANGASPASDAAVSWVRQHGADRGCRSWSVRRPGTPTSPGL